VYLESYLEIQPIYHYAERRIEAHIFLCFLALLLEWELAKRLRGYYEIAKEDKLAARKWKNCFKYANIDSKKGV